MDETALIAKVLLSSVVGSKVEVTLPSGTVLTGDLHSSLRDPAVRRCVVGRTLDLSKAYRQVACSPEDAWAKIIVVWSPVAEAPVFFLQNALPFGAAASVWSFNRASRALWRVGIDEFHLLWSNYVDDYPHIDIHALASSSRATSEAMFALTGWQVSVSDKKTKGFLPSFDALGANFDFGPAVMDSFFLVSNKEGRVAGLQEIVSSAVASGKFTMSEASSFRGKVTYAESYLFGRIARYAMGPVAERAAGAGSMKSAMTTDLERSLNWIVKHLAGAASRKVQVTGEVKQPILIFTDGACEGELFSEVTCGAIIFDPAAMKSEYFGLRVEAAIVQRWKDAGGVDQVIAQAELLPVLLARQVWAEWIRDRSVFFFIDNSSVLHCLINGFTKTQASRSMLLAISADDVKCPCRAWYSRVSSAANPADAPSRLKFK